ncbi:Rv1733c family protein [Amycolatopsis panacis]|nr:hypothetical protein [Amycolatopsis panacis]
MTIIQAFRPILWFARRIGLLPSPLRRTVDRLESLLVAVAILLALAAVPFAVAAGRAVSTGVQHTAAAQAAASTPVAATPVQKALNVPPVPTTRPVPVVWTLPDGSVHSGQVEMNVGTSAPTTVTIWVDRQGRQVSPPVGTDQAGRRGTVVGILTELAVILALTGLVALLRWPLNRHRAAGWENEWRIVGPVWTKHRI